MTEHIFTRIQRALPEQVRDKGMQKREDLSRSAWEVGDYVNEVFTHVGHIASKQECAAWVSALYDAHGYSTSTLLYKSEVAQVFSDNVRNYYHVLPFSHFAVAKASDDPLGTLEYSMDEFAKGYPISSKKLYAIRVNGVDPEEYDQADFHPDDLDPYENVTIEEIGQGITSWVGKLLSKLSDSKREQVSQLVARFLSDMKALITDDEVRMEK